MRYKLIFTKSANQEWRKLAPDLREQFTVKLLERLKTPRVANAALHEMKDCYKIKLRAAGYRLVYQVIDHQLIVEVVAVGERDGIYIAAHERIQ